MNLRRLILALFFLSLGHMVFGQAALALAEAEKEGISQTRAEDPCADEERDTDCPDEEKAFSEVPASDIAAILSSASDCNSNSCTGPECFTRGPCGSAAVHLGSKVSIPWPEPVALYFEFLPQAAQGPDPSPPIRPPIS